MGKYKIVVYAIAKNEAKYAEKWAKNMSEADEIYVLVDPTSTDGTKKILEENGVKVKEKLIRPWRFDKARNESLKLVPNNTDICVCVDLDELFNPGWRQILEDSWYDGVNNATYEHYCNAHLPNEIPVIFRNSKIHSRHDFEWNWLVHEHLVPKKGVAINSVFLKGVRLNHYPDMSKPRNYKCMLEWAYKKHKNNARYAGLLAEEYFGSRQFLEAEDVIKNMLKLKNLSSFDYGMAYKYLIKIRSEQGKNEEVKKLSYEALSKCESRVFFGELGRVAILNLNDYKFGIAMLEKCLAIKEDIIQARESEWRDVAWINNLISIGYYYLGNKNEALTHIERALKLKPEESVYLDNKKLYENMKNM